jgi:Protein of unknown function (DUF2510)
LREHRTVETLVTGFPALMAEAGRAVEHEVATVTGDLLSLNLLDLAVGGWNRYEALRDAARRTRDAPTTEEVVALVTHRIESSHRPTVELFIDGKSVGTIEVELDIAFDMAGVVAVVCQARLTAIRSGNCTVSGRLAIKGAVVAQRQRQFDLPGEFRLHHGVALLPAQQVVTASSPSRPATAAAGNHTGSQPLSAVPAGWYPDPRIARTQRYWDGAQWTAHTRPAGN